MTLNAGSRIGPYEILEPLGAGGMGEVYRARDTRLDRTVAIKVMGELVAGTAESRERFEREARAISQLNHPNICTLYDVGHQEGVSYLVLEYLEGETLASRIARGALPAAEALPIAIAICEALDKAHRQGIVHRDLKPGNVMLVRAGVSKQTAAQPPRGSAQVKLLDFGLAKIAASSAPKTPDGATPAGTALGLSMPVTQTTPLTLQGTILGTFQYMSPEMLEGAEADARADIWAFGCVLYEMLTGKKTFDGKTQASLISAILATEPAPLATLQPLTPPALEHTVKTCLEKDPDQRYQSAHDVLLQLKWVASAGSQAGVAAPVAARRRLTAYWRLAAAVSAAVIVTAAGVWKFAVPRATPPSVLRTSIALPPGVEYNVYGRNLAISPDGSRIVYGGFTTEAPALYMRRTDQRNAAPMPGTENATMPFFSPDGAWVGFFGQGKLRKVPVNGGAPIDIAPMTVGMGAVWLPDNTIVYSPTPEGGLKRVSADGGAVSDFTTPEPGEGSHRSPAALPDGSVIYAAGGGTSWSDAKLVVQPAGGGPRKVLPIAGAFARYVPTGHLVYGQSRTVFAVPFDPDTREVTGSARPVLDSLYMNDSDGRAAFAVSDTGVMVSVPAMVAMDKRRLVWVGFDGKVTALPLPERAYELPRVAPNGRFASVTIREDDPDVWIVDLSRNTLTPLTTEGGEDESGVWTLDSSRVAFASTRGGKRETRWRAPDGSTPEEVLFESRGHQHLAGWTPDGEALIIEESSSAGFDLFTAIRATKAVTPLVQNRFAKSGAQLSRDGRWLAYASNESGRAEIYVQGFGGRGARTTISLNGGTEPRWALDGRTLYYRNGDQMMAVAIETQPALSPGTPRVLFEGAFARLGWLQANYDMAPGGKGFLMVRGNSEALPTAIDVVSNWFEELRGLTPQK